MERKGLLDMDKVGFCPFSFLNLVHLIILVTVVSLVTSLISGVIMLGFLMSAKVKRLLKKLFVSSNSSQTQP